MPGRGLMKHAEVMAGTAPMSATDWVARLSGEPMEADWLAFEAWLQGAPERRGAYDKALTLWLDLDRQADPLAAAIADLLPERSSSRFARRPIPIWIGGALMSVVAVAVSVAALNPYQSPATTVYETARSEHRAFTLADGTRVTLNGGSKIAVSLERGRREVTLARGEAAFDVVHDARRPFEVHVGDQTLRDVGTEFDVLRADGDIIVTVRQGMVDVLPARGGRHIVSLGAGSQMQHHEGAAVSTVTPVSADDAFAWRRGQLIYRNQRLARIAADLNRYGDDQIHVDGPAADLRFSGVLAIDAQQVMVRRLAALLPISENRQDGVITLHGVNTAR
jgi:transmembrane sensor